MGAELALLAIPGMILFFISAILLLSLVVTAFWIWMLIDCLMRKGWQGTEQIAWVLLIILTNFLGALIYLFAIKLRKKKRK